MAFSIWNDKKYTWVYFMIAGFMGFKALLRLAYLVGLTKGKNIYTPQIPPMWLFIANFIFEW